MHKRIYSVVLFLSILFLNCFDDNPVMVTKKTFDPTSKIRKISQYSAQNKLEFYLSFTYDTEGRKKELKQFSSTDKLVGSYTLSYSDNETLSKQTLYTVTDDEKQVSGSHAFEYDDNGNEIKMSLFDGSGTLQEYYISEYYSLGRIEKESLFSASGELQKFYKYIYDDKNINTITHCYDGSGKLLTSSKNEYDAEGRIVKETILYDGNVIYYLTYEY